MADEESIETRGGKMLAKLLLACGERHWGKCSRRKLGAMNDEAVLLPLIAHDHHSK
jgi:hypothetical protein